jgi:ABC-type dipeptide/oligopeptide/nickel transport system permease subunit
MTSVAPTSADPIPGDFDRAARSGPLARAWQRLRRDRGGMVGLTIALLFFAMAIFGPFLAPHDPNFQIYTEVNKGPSWNHLLGTDELGRDMLSRVLAAARTGCLVATLATTISVALGTILGTIAGYFGGAADAVISRLIDFVQAFPYLLLAVFTSATVGPFINKHLGDAGDGSASLMIQYVVVVSSLGLVLWGGPARLIRGQLLSLREREFVAAARAEGARPWWLMRKHLIPNAVGPLIVTASLNFGGALLLEAALSFLGIGIQPPASSLGAMINQNLAQWRYNPRLILVPTLVLAFVLVGFSLLGDALNDALDPRRKGRR